MNWLLTLAIFTISLSPVHGQLRLIDRQGIEQKVNHDFTYEDSHTIYHVETAPYSTLHSLEGLSVGFFRDCIVLAWEVRPQYHNENWTIEIHHLESDEKYIFPLTKKGCRVFRIQEGMNTFDFHATNDNVVGLIAFDLYQALKVEVIPRE